METRIIDLGTLGTGTLSFGLSVSANGVVVVGYSFTSGTSFPRGFRWEKGRMVQLTGLDPNASTIVRAVNGDGSIIAGHTVAGGVFRAWRLQSGLYTSLGNLGHVSEYSQTFDCSLDGSIVVGESRNASGLFRAFKWTSGAGMVDLGLPASNPLLTQSFAYGISPDGTTIVGGSYYAGSYTRVTVWTPSSAIEIGLPPVPITTSYGRANAVSNEGTIVGIAGFGGVTDIRAFAYRSGVWTDLGTLAGFMFSNATDVSADGSVITGFCYNTTTNQFNGPLINAIAFRYANGVMTNIGNLGIITDPTVFARIQSVGSVPSDDPSLSSIAYSCSFDGQYITGSSELRTPSGALEQHAFLYGPQARARLPYYDPNRVFVAEAQKNQQRFSSAAEYTQFVKGRSFGRMYRTA
jgi:probable HAF family extracellular repeat protein